MTHTPGVLSLSGHLRVREHTLKEKVSVSLPHYKVQSCFFSVLCHFKKNKAILSFFFSSSPCLFAQAPLDQASEMSLVESGFEPGKRNFLQLADKDGEQPQIASVSGLLGRRTELETSCPFIISVLHCRLGQQVGYLLQQLVPKQQTLTAQQPFSSLTDDKSRQASGMI